MTSSLFQRARLSLGALSLALLLPASADTVTFPAATDSDGDKSKVYTAELIPVDADGVYLTVGVVGADVEKGKSGEQSYELLAQDPQSRLTFLRGPKGAKPTVFASARHLKGGDSLKSLVEGNASRVVSWESSYQDQQLPLNFLRVHHLKDLIPGQPLMNAEGQVVAICHQNATAFGKGTFAVPADAVLRNIADYKKHSSLRHCWLGMHLDVRNTAAYIVGTRPDSPAKKFGLQKGDVLLSVGDWPVADYSSAINAFYYLRAGQEVDFKILRGVELKTLKITPSAHPGYPEKK